jgi:hypothetical protein
MNGDIDQVEQIAFSLRVTVHPSFPVGFIARKSAMYPAMPMIVATEPNCVEKRQRIVFISMFVARENSFVCSIMLSLSLLCAT